MGDNMKKIGMILIGLLLCISCGKQEKMTEYKKFKEESYGNFDTITFFVGYAEKEKDFKEASVLFRNHMQKLNNLFDIYNNYEGLANVKSINDAAGVKPVKVEPELIELIEFSKTLYDKTGGKVNIAMGSVLKLWHAARENGEADGNYILPKAQDLQEASKHCKIDDIIVDKEKSTVFLKDPEMSLDIGSVAKGFAVEKSAELLEEKGIDSVIISAGGDVRTIGEPKETERNYWLVGIQNPDHPEDQSSLAAVLQIPKGMSVVTSGTYQRYFEKDGVRYHHLIDPKTLQPGNYFSSVSVICKDNALGDFLSTALFLSTKEEGEKIAKEFDVEVFWIGLDGKMSMTEGVKTMIQK